MSGLVFFVPWLVNVMLVALLVQKNSNLRAAYRREEGYKEIALQWQTAARNYVAALQRVSGKPPYPASLGAESAHSGKQNTADKSGASPELLPTQLDNMEGK